MLKKSPGMDRISPRVFKNCAEAVCEPLHHLFTQSLCYASLPCCLKIHKVVPVLKSGDSNHVKTYCPIFLLSVVSKVLERLIVNKIVDHISKSIIPSQFSTSADVNLY